VTKARTIAIENHIDPEGVWATSPDVPSWVIAGRTVSEVRDLVGDGLEFATGESGPFELAETFDYSGGSTSA
jgi:hypothetical protein